MVWDISDEMKSQNPEEPKREFRWGTWGYNAFEDFLKVAIERLLCFPKDAVVAITYQNLALDRDRYVFVVLDVIDLNIILSGKPYPPQNSSIICFEQVGDSTEYNVGLFYGGNTDLAASVLIHNHKVQIAPLPFQNLAYLADQIVNRHRWGTPPYRPSSRLEEGKREKYML